jgi:5'-phosphate synthase pdxT subunit
VAGKSALIGVLALQGDVREHELVLDTLHVSHRAVRTPAELAEVDGLIIPPELAIRLPIKFSL